MRREDAPIWVLDGPTEHAEEQHDHRGDESPPEGEVMRVNKAVGLDHNRPDENDETDDGDGDHCGGHSAERRRTGRSDGSEVGVVDEDDGNHQEA